MAGTELSPRQRANEIGTALCPLVPPARMNYPAPREGCFSLIDSRSHPIIRIASYTSSFSSEGETILTQGHPPCISPTSRLIYLRRAKEKHQIFHPARPRIVRILVNSVLLTRKNRPLDRGCGPGLPSHVILMSLFI